MHNTAENVPRVGFRRVLEVHESRLAGGVEPAASFKAWRRNTHEAARARVVSCHPNDPDLRLSVNPHDDRRTFPLKQSGAVVSLLGL